MKKLFTLVLFCVAALAHAQTNYNFSNYATLDGAVMAPPQIIGGAVNLGGSFTGKILTINQSGTSEFGSGLTQNVTCLTTCQNGKLFAGTDQKMIWVQNNGAWSSVANANLTEQPKIAITLGNDDILFIEASTDIFCTSHPIERLHNGTVSLIGFLPGMPQQATLMGSKVYIGCHDLTPNQKGLWIYDITNQTLNPSTSTPSTCSKISAVVSHGDTLYASGIDESYFGNKKVWRSINGLWTELLDITTDWGGGSEVLFMTYNQYANEVHFAGTMTNAFYSEKENTFDFYSSPLGTMNWVAFLPNGMIGVSGAVVYSTLVSTGLDEPEEHESGIKIYPNPTRDYVTVEGLKTPPTIANTLGQTVQVPFTQNGVKTTYDLHTLPNGTYFVGRTTIQKE